MFLMCCAVIGQPLASEVMKALHPTKEYGVFLVVPLLLCLLAGWWTLVLVHEAGHAAVAVAHGRSIRVFATLGWTWVKRGGTWHFLGRHNGPQALGGFVVPDRSWETAPHPAKIRFFLGGPLASLVYSIAALCVGEALIAFCRDAVSWTSPARLLFVLAALSLAITASVSAFLGLWNLLPITTGLFFETDGRQVLRQLRAAHRRTPAPDGELLGQLQWDCLLERRERDIDRHELARAMWRARNHETETIRFAARIMLASHYEDRGDAARAQHILQRLKTRISSPPDSSPSARYRKTYVDITLAVLQLKLDSDVAAARVRLASLPVVPHLRTYRDAAEVRVLVVEGRLDEATRLARRLLRRARTELIGVGLAEDLQHIVEGSPQRFEGHSPVA